MENVNAMTVKGVPLLGYGAIRPVITAYGDLESLGRAGGPCNVKVLSVKLPSNAIASFVFAYSWHKAAH